MIILGLFFLFIHKNICCGYSLEAPRRGASNEYPQHVFLWGIQENYPGIIIKYACLMGPLNRPEGPSLRPRLEYYKNKNISCSWASAEQIYSVTYLCLAAMEYKLIILIAALGATFATGREGEKSNYIARLAECLAFLVKCRR